MSDLERRSGSRPSRKQREQRAYRLVLATGAFGLVGVAGILLAIFTSFGAFWPVVALIIAAICFTIAAAHRALASVDRDGEAWANSSKSLTRIVASSVQSPLTG